MDTSRNKKKEVSNEHFFRVPSFIHLLWVPMALGSLSMMYLMPDSIPFDSLGPLGSVGLFLVQRLPGLLKGLFYFTWSAHALESCLAYVLCRKKSIGSWETKQWTAQTFIYGVFSLRMLMAYQPQKKN